jgi:hypothetical protein
MPVAHPGPVVAHPEPAHPEPGHPAPGHPEPGHPAPGRPEPGHPEPGRPEPGRPGLEHRPEPGPDRRPVGDVHGPGRLPERAVHDEPGRRIEPDRLGGFAGHGYNLPRGSVGPHVGPHDFRLTPHGEEAARLHLNEARLHMDGINRRPLPRGEMILHDNGRMVIRADAHRDFHLRPDGSIRAFRRDDARLRYGFDGRVHAFHDPHFDVRRGPRGDFRVYSRGPDRRFLVNMGPHRGFFEHPVAFRGRSYVRSTFVDHGRVSVRVYREFPYHGVVLRRYVPGVRYTPAFYGWAARPFPAPAPYHWGFVGGPAYTAHVGYFAVAPAYPAPTDWAADFMLATATGISQIVAASQAGPGAPVADDATADADAGFQADDEDWQTPPPDDTADAADAVLDAATADDTDDDAPAPQIVASSADAPVTPALKAQLAEEIRQQVELDAVAPADPDGDPKDALDGLPAQLQRAGFLFVVYRDQSADVEEGSICRLQPGDTIKLEVPVTTTDTVVQMRVASSHAKDCPLGTVVRVKLAALQEMWNSMRESMESGLAQMRYDPTQGGLPAPPLSSIAAPLQATVPTDLAAPDPGVAEQLDAQQRQADGAIADMEQSMNAVTPATPPSQQ